MFSADPVARLIAICICPLTSFISIFLLLLLPLLYLSHAGVQTTVKTLLHHCRYIRTAVVVQG